MRKKRLLLCILLIAILLCNSFTTLAEDSKKTYEKMKADSYAIQIDTNQIKGWPEGPSVYADSAIVMDIKSGAVLFGKKIEEKHYPASITKLLTVLIALENASLTDKVEFTQDSVSFLKYDDANIGMRPGEIISMEDALYAVLLASANEVAHAVAECVGTQHLGGNYDTFIEKMNTRSKELGCINSNWINSYGLHNEQHYTCAYDMAKIASAISSNEIFREMMKTSEHKIGATNLVKEERVFQQTHKILNPHSEYYRKNCIGGKTGYTEEAMNTLVTMEENNNMQLVAVVLYDYGAERYLDTQKMLEYGFNNFKQVPITDHVDSKMIEKLQDVNASIILPKNVEISQLKQEVVLTDKAIRSGQLVYTYEGHEVGRFDVLMTEEGYNSLKGNIEQNTIANEEADHKNMMTLEIIFTVLMMVIVIMVLIKIILIIKRRRCQSRSRR